MAIEPVSTTIAAVVGVSSFIGALWDRTPCRIVECCDKYSVSLDGSNLTALQNTLERSVYGQHLMKEIVIPALRGHVQSTDPKKALVLSFHGSPGSGKSYVSQFIAESFYKFGMRSKFVRKFLASTDFPNKEEKQISLYQIQIQEEIKQFRKNCERPLFIFEDVHLMPSKVLDSVRPFIDYHEEVMGLDYRKSIFIFLSNTGQNEINKKTLEFWKAGTPREEIGLRDFENVIKLGSFNEKGGFYRSDTITSNLIDYYIPFLPMEEKHVRACINDEFQKFGYGIAPPEAVKSILGDMTFMPEEEKIYSTAGCKRIGPKVAAYVSTVKYDLS